MFSSPRRTFRTLLLCFLVFAGITWVSFSIMDILIRRPGGIKPDDILDEPTVTFSALNPLGQKIAGYWYQGKSGAGAILLCHGHGVWHGNLKDMIAFLRPHGFSLLLLDFRAHGRSEGDFTSIGLLEWEDIDVILQEAEKRGLLTASMPLAAYGRSMGAAALAYSARHIQRIQAFILESMYAELRIIAATDLRNMTGLPDNPLIDLVFFVAKLRTGIPFMESKPANELGHIAPRPLLLIHDAKDRRVTGDDFKQVVAAASGAHPPKTFHPWNFAGIGHPWQAQTLIFPEGVHVGAHSSEPRMFEEGVLQFLASAGILPPAPNH